MNPALAPFALWAALAGMGLAAAVMCGAWASGRWP